MMGGGSGGAQNTVSEFKPPEYTLPGWQAYVNAGQNISQTPYVQSGLPTVAPINDYQNTAYQMAYDRALYGAPDLNAGRGAAMQAAQGDMANPWQSNLMAMGAGKSSNPYASDKYTDQMIANTSADMANAHATGSAANTAAAAARSGAFGGSAYEETQAAGAAGLAKAVGNMATATRQQQQQYQGNMWNQDQQNMMQANSMGGAMFNQDVGNRLSGAALAGQLSKDDYESIRMLGGAGNDFNSYQQRLMDALNQQWGLQNGYDATMNEYLGNVLARASGGQGQTTVTQNGGGYSPYMGLLGGGLAAYGAMK
jgi:hypothetical protein